MDARFYNSDRIDIERLASDLVNAYIAQGYQAQQLGDRNQMLVQIKKGGDIEAILGMQAALSLNLQRTGGGVVAMIGQQRWIDKAAVGAVGLVALPVLWPLALTAGVGALRQASLGNQVLNMVDGMAHQQVPGVQIGPVPYNLMPQMQQQAPYYTPPQQPQYAPPQPTYAPPAPTQQAGQQKLRCSNCNTPYEPGDTFCSGCGRSLTPPRMYCSKCNTEVKPGAAFCPKCGTSTFYSATSTSQPVPAPAPAPASTPSATSYAPPAPQRPPTPVYTPPPTPTYTPKPQPDPHAMPTEQAEITYYVPSNPQTPPVAPQPKVTVTQAPKKEPAPAAPPPPEKVYYVPSTQSQQAQPAPAEQPTIIPDTAWGTLVLPGGKEVQLKGERAIVGRSDQDVGGIQPDVDLSKQDGADTVSRIHAAIEHSGGAFTVTDLNSTNATRINNKRLDPDVATPINDGDSVQFGKISCTFKKV